MHVAQKGGREAGGWWREGDSADASTQMSGRTENKGTRFLDVPSPPAPRFHARDVA